MKSFFKTSSHIQFMNHCDHPSLPTIGEQFPLALGKWRCHRERAGVRESRSNENITLFTEPTPNRACVLECGGNPGFAGATPLSNVVRPPNGNCYSMSFDFQKRCHSHRTPGPYGGSDDSRRRLNKPVCKVSVLISSLLLTLTLTLLTGCSRPTVLIPTEIHYGVETCAECGMIINDQHYAAALAWRDSSSSSDDSIQTAVFDDIGCLLEWRQKHTGVQIAALWVKNVHTGDWLDAPTAIYLKNPQLHTPMGGGIAAGATTNDFAMLPVQQPTLTWTNLNL